ncbi:hypothetical protein ABZX40_39160 [Streptomyces sp. NPDC004610]|uniref:hypothetical protein n=1 Tax=unclassified Streptomyces TaxID=2593676 RepID=UPI0033AA57D2
MARPKAEQDLGGFGGGNLPAGGGGISKRVFAGDFADRVSAFANGYVRDNDRTNTGRLFIEDRGSRIEDMGDLFARRFGSRPR